MSTNLSLRSLLLAVIVTALSPAVAPHHSAAQEKIFPNLPELAGAVDFWKQIFSQFSARDVVFFDPMDPAKIYSVLRAPESEEGRLVIDKERARIIADYDLNEDDPRIRTQRGARELFLSGLKTAGRYLPQMQNILRAEGVPSDLAYLPLVESSFNVRARSNVGAAGIWQFMAGTGKKFLRIDDAVDERMDPIMSTRAAARLLKENYRLFGNWPLAITAYNHGTEGIFQGINTVGSENLADLIRGYQSPTFGFASRNFYAEFLAAVEVAKNRDVYFPFLRTLPPIHFQEVPVTRQTAIHALLKPAAISPVDFFEWNPAISPTSKYLPTGYRVKLPPEKLASFLSAQRRTLPPAPSMRSVSTAARKTRDRPVATARRPDDKKKVVSKRKNPGRSALTGLPSSTRSADRRA
ncbi:MAG TPA: transglycosylase SLT domain-containing protein [Candidatus Binatia bacterium]|jgi:membrane-bound lytic murein transglycosylase D